MCHNINRLSCILPEQYHPVLNTCLSNILSNNELTTSTGSSVALGVKHLRPNATLPYTTATGVVDRVDSSGRDNVLEKEATRINNSVDCCQQFLVSTTTRETLIENEVCLFYVFWLALCHIIFIPKKSYCFSFWRQLPADVSWPMCTCPR